MRRMLSVIAVAVAMAGCVPQSSEETGAITTETTPVKSNPVSPKSNPLSPWTDDESLYLTLMVTEYPEVVGRFGNEFIANYGHTLCDAVDEGTTWEDIVGWTIQYNVDPEMIGFMTGAAIQIFCPWNRGIISQ